MSARRWKFLMAVTLAVVGVDASADAAPPSSTVPPTSVEPQYLDLRAPSGVVTGEHYSFTGDGCGTGWTITSVEWYLSGIASHQPVFPQPVSPTDIVQTATGIEVSIVAGVTARPFPPVPGYVSVTFEHLDIRCSLDGASVVLRGGTTVFPENGIAWGEYPRVDPARPLVAVAEVGTRVCTVGTTATLRVEAVPGPSGLLTAPVVAASGGWWMTGATSAATFDIPFASGPGWTTVDYTFTCQTASGTATSSFHHPDWGLFDVPPRSLPAGGGSPWAIGWSAAGLLLIGVALIRIVAARPAR